VLIHGEESLLLPQHSQIVLIVRVREGVAVVSAVLLSFSSVALYLDTTTFADLR
jgi:hypothetical protein